MRSFCVCICLIAVLATTAVSSVSVSSPGNGATVGSPVSFVAGASSATCAKGVASGRATKNAIDNVARFFRDNKTLKGFGYKAKEAVIKYLEEQLAAGKSARLDAICHVAVAHVPADLVDEIVGLKDYLNSEKHKVPDDFTVNAKSLKEKTRIKGDAANWSLQFERGALGKDPAADVYYDEGRKKLTLSNLTAELVGVIEKELLARVG